MVGVPLSERANRGTDDNGKCIGRQSFGARRDHLVGDERREHDAESHDQGDDGSGQIRLSQTHRRIEIAHFDQQPYLEGEGNRQRDPYYPPVNASNRALQCAAKARNSGLLHRRRKRHWNIHGVAAAFGKGSTMVAVTPPSSLFSSMRAALPPNCAASLARTLARPVPTPEPGAKPTPVSAMLRINRSSSTRAATRMCPPSGAGFRPC